MALDKLNEEIELIHWLDDTLGTALGLNVYLDLIPPGKIPAVRVTVLSREDARALSNQKEIYLTHMDTLVVVTAESSGVGNLKTQADLLHQTLDAASGSTNDAWVVSCIRTQPWHQSDYQNGVMYRSFGGIYRISMQAKAA